MSARIFISYRRNDCNAWAGRLYDRLTQVFSPADVFMDVEGIEPGANFRDALNRNLAACQVALIVIGRQWLNFPSTSGGRAIDDPNDFVQLEVEAVLKRNVRVIPVLVDGAAMPAERDLPGGLKDLAWRQAVPITHASFIADAQALIETVTRAALAENFQVADQHSPATAKSMAAPQASGTRPDPPKLISILVIGVGAVGAAIAIWSAVREVYHRLDAHYAVTIPSPHPSDGWFAYWLSSVPHSTRAMFGLALSACAIAAWLFIRRSTQPVAAKSHATPPWNVIGPLVVGALGMTIALMSLGLTGLLISLSAMPTERIDHSGFVPDGWTHYVPNVRWAILGSVLFLSSIAMWSYANRKHFRGVDVAMTAFLAVFGLFLLYASLTVDTSILVPARIASHIIP